MAFRSRSALAPVALVLAAAWCCFAPSNNYVSPPRAGAEIEPRVAAAVAAGLSPLAAVQPASAYDSVVAMLQSWMVGGTVLAIIMGACLVAATANPLTKRRQEAMRLAREASGQK
eukprot:TRINITY_DN534_c0_g2_i1.p2 TRINITY_DN534_c0_g2~~TRINITY_DN534_c0_g2_i1.p2  ORF type:complete len:115 (-),score=27.07 TRINITY_DN534_c0_g2_i1:179-523(-)